MIDRPSLHPSARRPARIFRMLGLMAMLLAPIAHAERADRDKPMNIESDRMTYDDVKQINIFTGNVTITKGTILLKAERVEVTQDPEGYQYATAFAKPGGLAYMRQKRDGVDEYIDGWGEKIQYNGKTEVATLTTRAILKRLASGTKTLDEIRGSTITYDTYNEVYTANGGRDQVGPNNPSGRVRATLAPRNATQPATAEASGNATTKPSGNASAPAGGIPLTPSNRIGTPRE